jgi:hypothetical protein
VGAVLATTARPATARPRHPHDERSSTATRLAVRASLADDGAKPDELGHSVRPGRLEVAGDLDARLIAERCSEPLLLERAQSVEVDCATREQRGVLHRKLGVSASCWAVAHGWLSHQGS